MKKLGHMEHVVEAGQNDEGPTGIYFEGQMKKCRVISARSLLTHNGCL